jgi:hypothetical protein
MSRLGRWLLIERMKLSREAAESVARVECERRGFAWVEPVRVYRSYGDWSVVTGADRRPHYVRIIVDGGTGEVRRFFLPLPR